MTAPTSAAAQQSPSLEYIFHPRSVAVVGALAEPERWWLKAYFIDPLLRFGYRGQIYGVNPKGGGIADVAVYPSLHAIPGPVDHVVGCVSARRTPELVAECRDLGVKTIHIFSAGFAETGEEEGIEIQRRLTEIARPSGMRIVGPNCMGLYCPQSGLSFCTDFPQEPGPVGLICQSGGNTTYIIRVAARRGLRFSKGVSYGNACDIDECDLLEYMTGDPQTRVIAAYIEGTKDGPRLVEALATAASVKPVVVFKGGYTDGGRRATASHTGALAGSDAVWDGLLRRVGAVRVYSVEEMVDVLVALLRMRPPRGPNACVAGNGGGASVLATDECEREGVRLPPIPPEVRDRLKTFIPLAGSMLRNPIDTNGLNAISQRERVVGKQTASGLEDIHWDRIVAPGDRGWGDLANVLEDWRGIDLAIFHYSIDLNPMEVTEAMVALAVGPMIAAAKKCRLPVAGVLHFLANESSRQASLRAQQMCLEAGLPLFLSMRGAAGAIRRLIEFGRAHPGMLGPGQ